MQFSTVLASALVLLATSAGAAPVSQNVDSLAPRAGNGNAWILSQELEKREAALGMGFVRKIVKKMFPGRKPPPGSPAAIRKFGTSKNFHGNEKLARKTPNRQDSGVFGPRV